MSINVDTRRIKSGLVSPVAVTVIAVLVGWQIASTFVHPTDFPGLPRLAENLYMVLSGTGEYHPLEHIPITILRISIGFTLAMVIATFLGIVMGINRSVERYLITTVIALLAFPSVVWALLAVSWFGLRDMLVPVFVITIIVIPYATVNILGGAKAVDDDLTEMASTFKASRYQVWTDIYIPHLKPYLFSTFRIAFAISWKISLVAEIFGTSRGVGFVVDYYFQVLRGDMIIAWALPVMAFIFIVDRVLKRIEDRSFEWRPEMDTEQRAA